MCILRQICDNLVWQKIFQVQNRAICEIAPLASKRKKTRLIFLHIINMTENNNPVLASSLDAIVPYKSFFYWKP